MGKITKNQIKLIVLDVSRSHHALGYQANNIQLHEFSDASEVVYDAVALFIKTEKLHFSFAMVKTKLASIKTISLSRLKLSATQNDYKRNRSRNSNDQVLNRLCVGTIGTIINEE